MTSSHAPALTARTVSALVRGAIGSGNAACHTRTPGVVLVVITANADRTQDREVLARAVVAAALQAGYEATRSGEVVTVVEPEPAGDGEPVTATVVEVEPVTARRVSALLNRAGYAGRAETVGTGVVRVLLAPGTWSDTEPAIREAYSARAAALLAERGYAVESLDRGGVLMVTDEEVAAERAETVDELLDRAEERARHETAATARAVAEEALASSFAGDGLVHLLSDDLLDACGTAGPGGLSLAPFTTPEAITCPRCRPLAEEERVRTVETDHAAALAPPTAGPLTHEHEEWQLDESPLGGRYCRACGATVDEPAVDDGPREQPAPLEWSEVAEVRA